MRLVVGVATEPSESQAAGLVPAVWVARYGAEIQEVRDMDDKTALDRIQEMLRDPEWGVGMLEDIAYLVNMTGRDVQNYPDGRSTWERH